MNDFLPLGLQFGKGLFVQMARIAPAVAKLVQGAQLQLPVGVVRMGLTPSAQLFHHGQALTPVLNGLVLEFVQPLLHHFIGFVASRIKALPQSMVGHAALVGELPLVAQLAQGFLHLAPAHGRDFCRGLGCGDTSSLYGLEVRGVGCGDIRSLGRRVQSGFRRSSHVQHGVYWRSGLGVDCL